MPEQKTFQIALDRSRSIIGHIEEATDPLGICILVHGIGDRRSSFDGLINEITCRRFSTLCFDLPGHGENYAIAIPFEENIDLLDRIIDQCTREYSQLVVIGHSLGGLIVLLSLCRHRPNRPPLSVLVVEASITESDQEFFKWIQEPPTGVGYEGLLASSGTDSYPYARTYAANLAGTSRETFRRWASTVYTNFLGYREQIIDGGATFTYAFGLDSPGSEARQSLGKHPNIRVLPFPEAAHWVHIDSQPAFIQRAVCGLLAES